MEGPSLYLAAEQLDVFKGKKVQVVSGNTKIGKERLVEKTVRDIFSWGKHLVLQFDKFALRIHFMLFGTYEAEINGISVTGDYKRTREPRLTLTFPNGDLKLFNCSLKFIDDPKAKKTYDFSIDIMHPLWDPEKALQAVEQQPDVEIGDVLLDQTIFSGVGNIIKNEVLSLTKINPTALVATLSDKKLQAIIHITREFSLQFYAWRKDFVLRKHLLIYQKKVCPHCEHPIIRDKTGKRQRWSYYCPVCQKQ